MIASTSRRPAADAGQGGQPWVSLADPGDNEFRVLGVRRG